MTWRMTAVATAMKAKAASSTATLPCRTNYGIGITRSYNFCRLVFVIKAIPRLLRTCTVSTSARPVFFLSQGMWASALGCQGSTAQRSAAQHSTVISSVNRHATFGIGARDLQPEIRRSMETAVGRRFTQESATAVGMNN